MVSVIVVVTSAVNKTCGKLNMTSWFPHWMNLQIKQWPCEQALGREDPLALSIAESEDAEEALILKLAHEQRTKMCLARLVQQLGRLREGETLEAAWKQTKEALTARVQDALPPDPPAPPEPAPRGRARGRGRGAPGRGRRGRGRA